MKTMKRAAKLSIALLFVVNLLSAQDTLALKNNSKFLVKIKEVGTEEITYLNYSNLDGPSFIVKKGDVDYITYSDGYKQTMETNNIPNETPRDLYFRGQRDADQFYRGYHGAGTATLVVSLLSPLVGLIPAVACSATPPKKSNLEYPDSQAFQKTDYQNGYMKQAKRIKSRKVWTNWGIAFGVNVVLVLMLQQH